MALALSVGAKSGWVRGTNVGNFRSRRSRSAMREQAAQVERAGQAVDLAVADPQLADQQVEHLVIDVLLDLEPDRRAEPAPGQLLLQGGEEVLGVVLLDLEVLVAGDPEGEVLMHLHPGEELVEVARDDVLERDEALALDLGVDVLLDEDEAGEAAAAP